MSLPLSVILFLVGLGLILFAAERLVKAAIQTSMGFGISTFLISVIFIGFDPENLAVGAIASLEGRPGIALGSVIGSTMVAIGMAFGVTALIVPMRFDNVPKPTLAVPIAAVLLFGLLAWDGELAREDGVVLLISFGLAICLLAWLSRKGLDIRPSGEVAEALEQRGATGKWRAMSLLLLSLALLVVGSECVVKGGSEVIAWMGLSETVFGMTALALLISLEELARELPAALKGRPEITFGNVTGSVLAFFLFNAGIMAIVRPVTVDSQVLHFYLPMCVATLFVISITMMTKQVSRWAGGILLALYGIFVFGG